MAETTDTEVAETIEEETPVAESPKEPPPVKDLPIRASAIFVRAELVSVLDSLAPAIKPRSPKPILACCKMSQADQSISVMATDIAITIVGKINNVEIDSWEDVAIPLLHCLSILKTIPDDTVELRVQGESMKIIAKRCDFNIWLGAVQEFPGPPEIVKDCAKIEISQADLRRMSKQTRYICPDDRDGWMQGVFLGINKDRLEMMSTDGRRAVHTSIWVKPQNMPPGETKTGSLVPTDTLKAVIESFPEGEDYPITIRLSAARVEFEAADIAIASVTLEGRFLNDQIAEFTQGESAMDFRVPRDAMIDALKQARLVLLSDETSSPDVWLKAEAFMGSNNATLVITGKTIQRGEARIEVPIVFTKQTPQKKFSVKLNADFLRDGIGVTSGEIFVRWNSDSRPVIIDQGNYHFVLMPLNPMGGV